MNHATIEKGPDAAGTATGPDVVKAASLTTSDSANGQLPPDDMPSDDDVIIDGADLLDRALAFIEQFVILRRAMQGLPWFSGLLIPTSWRHGRRLHALLFFQRNLAVANRWQCGLWRFCATWLWRRPARQRQALSGPWTIPMGVRHSSLMKSTRSMENRGRVMKNYAAL